MGLSVACALALGDIESTRFGFRMHPESGRETNQIAEAILNAHGWTGMYLLKAASLMGTTALVEYCRRQDRGYRRALALLAAYDVVTAAAVVNNLYHAYGP